MPPARIPNSLRTGPVAEKEYRCPKCRAVLELSESQRSFAFIFASWTRCLECGVEVLIKDDVPTIQPRVQ